MHRALSQQYLLRQRERFDQYHAANVTTAYLYGQDGLRIFYTNRLVIRLINMRPLEGMDRKNESNTSEYKYSLSRQAHVYETLYRPKTRRL